MSSAPAGLFDPSARPRLILGLLFLLTAGIFVADLLLPRQVAAGVTYVPIILLAVWLLPPTHVRNWLGVLAVLIVAGFILSPATGPAWLELVNPVLSISVVTATALVGLRAKSASEQRLLAENELHQAHQRASQSERLAAIGQVVATLSHECRNTLQRMLTGLELLKLEVGDRPDALQWLNHVRQAQGELQCLFEDLRNYSAPLKLGCEPCNAAEVWRSAWNALSEVRQGRQAELREEVGEVDLQCTLDARRMGQVFRNLFENSLAACPDPVEVDIHCTPTLLDGASALKMEVHDNGPGLSVEQRQRVFDAFYTTKTTGSGLGMAIVKRIVEAHGGTIVVADPATPGAEFVIVVPRAAGNGKG